MPESFRRSPPVVIGLIGGIAAGKSTVAGLLEAAGLVRLDADRVAREVVEEPAVAASIRQRFGDGVFLADGALDRMALAQVAFAAPEARRDLEAITHPAIRATLLVGLEEALQTGRSVLLDVPLLIEGGLVERCDEVLFVDAEDQVRAARARERGWEDDELPRREAAQAALTVKKAAATATIDNSGSLDRTRAQVDAFLARLQSADT